MKNLHDKLFSRGAASLSDEELLALLIESSDDKRDALSVATSVLAQCGSLAALPRQELSRLRMVEGIGLRRAERLHLAAEYGRRVAMATMSDVESISTDNDVVRMMRPHFDTISHEECWVLYLTSSNRLLERQRVSQGGVQATVVDHRLIVMSDRHIFCKQTLAQKALLFSRSAFHILANQITTPARVQSKLWLPAPD